MTRRAPIPPALAMLRPPSLDALARLAGPVTAANAEAALYELSRHERTPERVRAWDAARAAWAVLSADERAGIIGPTTERANAAGATNTDGALSSPPDDTGGQHGQ